MAKKFKCSECGGKNIDEILDGFRRKSGVINTYGSSGERIFSSSKPEFHQISQLQPFYQCHDCSYYLGIDVEDIIRFYFHEETISSPPAPKPAKLVTYKMHELKHCESDNLSVRELTDVVNFLIHAGGNKFTVQVGSEHPASIDCLKFIKRGRPYLFEKIK